MNSFPKSAWLGQAAGRERRPRCLAVRRRPALFAWPVVIAAATLSLWLASVAVAQRPEVRENSIGMRLVRIPAGEFEMGSEKGLIDEKPVHPVRITRAFLLGETEVTQAQWKKVMDSSPWKGQDYVREGADVAATYVSWDDAVEFCARLTKLEQSSGTLLGNRRYRLPTEAEWEYACRAGTMTQFSFGDDKARLGEFAWIRDNTWDKDEKYAHEVGQKNPNPWGLHDMHGNAWEWCSDWIDTDYYAKSPTVDPKGPDAGSSRVIRGGGWITVPFFCRSSSCSSRCFGEPAKRNHVNGFRVVCELE